MLLVLFCCVFAQLLFVYMLTHIYWTITDNEPTEYRNIECETDKLENMSDFLNSIQIVRENAVIVGNAIHKDRD